MDYDLSTVLKILNFPKFEEGFDGEVIFLTKYGSHLYGTVTENSDLDIRGIFLPPKNSLLLGKAKHSFSFIKEDTDLGVVDVQLWSFHKLLQKLQINDTNALDLVYAYTNSDAVLLIDNKWKQFLDIFTPSKNIKGMVGYVYYQAKKYGIKGNNIDVLRKILAKLPVTDERLDTYFPVLKEIPDIKFEKHHSTTFVIVLGKKFPGYLKTKHFIEKMQEYLYKYGKRALQAEMNEGIDWKALYHACRCLLQANQLLTSNTIYFPFVGFKKQFLLDVKLGKLNFNDVKEFIEEGLEELDKLVERSSLPYEININDLEELLLSYYL